MSAASGWYFWCFSHSLGWTFRFHATATSRIRIISVSVTAMSRLQYATSSCHQPAVNHYFDTWSFEHRPAPLTRATLATLGKPSLAITAAAANRTTESCLSVISLNRLLSQAVRMYPQVSLPLSHRIYVFFQDSLPIC